MISAEHSNLNTAQTLGSGISTFNTNVALKWENEMGTDIHCLAAKKYYGPNCMCKGAEPISSLSIEPA